MKVPSLREAELSNSVPYLRSVVGALFAGWVLYKERRYAAICFPYHGRPLSQPVLSDATYVRGFTDIFRSLRLLHNASVCHRDVSRENIVVDDDGNCRLIDFGRALKYEPRTDTRHRQFQTDRYYDCQNLFYAFVYTQGLLEGRHRWIRILDDRTRAEWDQYVHTLSGDKWPEVYIPSRGWHILHPLFGIP